MNLKKNTAQKIRIEIYSKNDCHLCEEAKAVLSKVQKEVPFELREIDITRDVMLFHKYKEQIPVVFVNDRKAFKFVVNEKKLRKKLSRLL